MKRLSFVCVLFATVFAFGESQQPPYEEKSWETNENFRNVFLELDNIRARLDSLETITALPTDVAPRTNVTPAYAGQLIFNSADLEVCVSTGTSASTWTNVEDGTACSH